MIFTLLFASFQASLFSTNSYKELESQIDVKKTTLIVNNHESRYCFLYLPSVILGVIKKTFLLHLINKLTHKAICFSLTLALFI